MGRTVYTDSLTQAVEISVPVPLKMAIMGTVETLDTRYGHLAYRLKTRSVLATTFQ